MRISLIVAVFLIGRSMPPYVFVIDISNRAAVECCRHRRPRAAPDYDDWKRSTPIHHGR